MSYAVKYKITVASQSGSSIVLDMLTDGYVGSIIEYPATYLNLQYIPSSDDPFEPIYASQLGVGIDVTDNVANMPDFTEMDDRQYWCKYYVAGVLKWQGWALSDSISFIFSTGRKEIQFNAICGLGMLDKIDFTSFGTGYRNIILQYIFDCLRPLEFPTQPTLLASLSIYSSTMFNRNDDIMNEPWNQSYMALNNFIQIETDEQGVSRNKFNSLQVLRDILISWGCRIFMANGEWNILQINQQCEGTRYWNRYTFESGYLESGTFTGSFNIPTNGIFVNNEQTKVYRKGFNNFVSFKQIKFPENLLYNADLKLFTGTDAEGWDETVGGTGYIAIKENQDRQLNAFILALGNVTTGALAQVTSLTPMSISVGDSPKIQFRIYNTTANTDVGGTLLPNCLLKIIVSGSGASYYLTDNNEWKILTIGVSDYYKVNDKANNTLVNLEEIPGAPISGNLSFAVLIQGSGVNTQSALIIGDFQVTVNSEFKSVQLTAKINDTNTYRKDITFPHGYNIQTTDLVGSIKPAYYGAITDIDGNQMYGWYMQERLGTDNYFSLAHLMFQNYINMLRKNIINVEGNIEGTFYPTQTLSFTDLDPSQISVQGTKYLIGNCTYIANRNECQGTFLQIDNTYQEANVETVYDNGVGVGIAQNMHNGAALSSSAACAFTTYTLTKYSVQFLPVLNDVIYNDIDLTQPFAGNTLWYKFFIPYFNTTRSYRINASGVITEVSTC